MKVALVAPHALHVKAFWLSLAKALMERGFTVHLYSAGGEETKELEELGILCYEIPFNRFVAPLSDLRMALALYTAFRRERYDVVHNFTIKANVFGALAARAAGCPRIIDMVLGLGYAFSGRKGWRGRALRLVATILYRIGFAACSKACLINSDNYEEVLKLGLLSPDKAVLIKSATGVNLSIFSMEAVDAKALNDIRNEIDAEPGAPVVLMAGRLFWSKGVREFFEAAKALAPDYPQARFLLVGPAEAESPEAVPQAYLRQQLDTQIRWLGFRTDMRELMALADIFVLPSYYGEGLPQVLQEAVALGKPVVTTDNVGCREAVQHNQNGFLIPVRDSRALTEAIRKLLEQPDLCARFGVQSRLLAERDFDSAKLTQRILTELYGL
ncbi:MAG: glycosyltransferase family 4 protein [Deltaproteobacteria bacterium]|nr:glycosyltransferase family 4 protein [Deltaproteobacteria bacterium]